MNPLVSVVVPCYNQAQYLPETLNSVLQQEYENWECLIINDGSPDNTEEVAQEWCKKDSRFKYHKKENQGLAHTRNYGINLAEGVYILPLDSDDYIGSQYLSEAIKAFKKDPETKLVYCNRTLFGTKNQKLILKPYSFEDMLTENRIPPSGIFKKSDFLKTNGYNTKMSTQGLEDWDFWLSLLDSKSKVVKLEGYHFFYRVKEVSMLTEITIQKNEELLKEIFIGHVSSFLEFFNPIRDHIEADYYKKRVHNIQQSAEFKVGSIICFPFRIVKKAYKKIFK